MSPNGVRTQTRTPCPLPSPPERRAGRAKLGSPATSTATLAAAPSDALTGRPLARLCGKDVGADGAAPDGLLALNAPRAAKTGGPPKPSAKPISDHSTWGHVDMRTTDGVIHDAVFFATAFFDADGKLVECP